MPGTESAASLLWLALYVRRLGLLDSQVPPPVEDIESMLTPLDIAQLAPILSHAIVGGPQRVRSGLADLVTRTGADEVIVASHIYDHAARKRSRTTRRELLTRPLAQSRSLTILRAIIIQPLETQHWRLTRSALITRPLVIRL